MEIIFCRQTVIFGISDLFWKIKHIFQRVAKHWQPCNHFYPLSLSCPLVCNTCCLVFIFLILFKHGSQETRNIKFFQKDYRIQWKVQILDA